MNTLTVTRPLSKLTGSPHLHPDHTGMQEFEVMMAMMRQAHREIITQQTVSTHTWLYLYPA